MKALTSVTLRNTKNTYWKIQQIIEVELKMEDTYIFVLKVYIGKLPK